MKSAGKARNNGLYRHIRTSKEIIRNLLNDYTKSIGNKRKGTVFSSKCIRTTSIYRMQIFNYYLTNFSVYCYAYY